MLVLAAASGVGRAAAASEEPAAAFGEETSVVVVEVPVEVSRGGKPVVGLAAADFEVRERGKSLPIVGFEQVEIGAPSTPDAAANAPGSTSLAARRHVFLLFD
ncbi:MAG TPA: hypothetical protein VN923_17370, partial [Thermoanaerobaculia bacterium]|nr:hypothetical protein [Thermoanaerobaculia bacterium]